MFNKGIAFKEKFKDLILLYFPFFVLFFLIPASLYTANQSEFDLQAYVIVPFLVFSALILIVLFLIILFTKPTYRRARIASIFFYIGIFLCLSDIISAHYLSEIGADPGGLVREPALAFFIRVFLILTIFFLAKKIPLRLIRTIAAPSIFAIFLVSIFLNGNILTAVFNKDVFKVPKTSKNIIKTEEWSKREAAHDPTKKNVYHFVFDLYSGYYFLDMVKKLGIEDNFDGFTFFPKNSGNYNRTEDSLPSFMTGAFYPYAYTEKQPNILKYRNGWKRSGLPIVLKKAGYTLHTYTASTPHSPFYASDYGFKTLDVRKRNQKIFLAWVFADLWLMRIAPDFTRPYIYNPEKGGILSRNTGKLLKGVTKTESVSMMRELIRAEPFRPQYGQYIYGFFMIPHGVWVLDENCFFSEEADRLSQAVCTTRVMGEFIRELKKMGRYHNSIIILQSDHGDYVHGPSDPSLDGMTKEIEDHINKTKFAKHLRANMLNKRTYALLVIKPPETSGVSLAVSDRQTQLADIPATIYNMLSLKHSGGDGMSVFAEDFPDEREIHFFNSAGVGSPGFDHFSHLSRKSWKIYPKIFFKAKSRALKESAKVKKSKSIQ